MSDPAPAILIPGIPGGEIIVSEAGLPGGSRAGEAATGGAYSFGVSAPAGVARLTIGGYEAVRDGVFRPGSADLGYGRLSVTGFDPATGTVSVLFSLLGPTLSGSPGATQRYGDLRLFPVSLTDGQGRTAENRLIVQIRDDDFVLATDDNAIVPVGGEVRGDVVGGADPDRFSADGFGGVTAIILASTGESVTVGAAGSAELRGAHGVLTLSSDGGFHYRADPDAPAGARESFLYRVQDGDGDGDLGLLAIDITAPPAPARGPTQHDDHLTGLVLDGGVGDDTLISSGDGSRLRGGVGDDVLIGAAGFDDLHGNVGDDTVSGLGGDDWVVGGQGQDSLSGGDGGDIVYGNLGDDTADGGAGDDIVRGGQGDDRLHGGAGRDFVSGDMGDDVMSGGEGADIFHAWHVSGVDRVLDFNAAEGDRVQLLAGSRYSLLQSGDDLVIDIHPGGRLILENVTLAGLQDGWLFTA